jgi:transcriptional regulator with XRE-family HTH domain
MLQYQKNFIAGIKLLMADNELINMKEVAAYVGISYMSLWKIMEGANKPTVDQCLLLCKKADYSANWLFLNIGPKTISEELSLSLVFKKLDEIKKKLP